MSLHGSGAAFQTCLPYIIRWNLGVGGEAFDEMNITKKSKPETRSVAPARRPKADSTEIYGPTLEQHYRQAIAYLASGGRPTISGLQRKLKVGFKSASFLMDVLEKRGAVRPLNYSKNYVHDVEFEELELTPKQYEAINYKDNTLYREFIEDKTNRDIRGIIEDAASTVLGQHFLDFKVSKVEKRRLITEMADAVLQGLHSRSAASSQGNEVALSFPETAPKIYPGLRGPETPPEFIKRVYEPWLGHGLDRAHIRQLDPKLYTAINNWLSRPGNVWPQDVDLPTREEQNRRMIDQLRAKAPDGQVGKVLGDFTSREAMRIRSVMQRHK
jgi:hypothetical protein